MHADNDLRRLYEYEAVPRRSSTLTSPGEPMATRTIYRIVVTQTEEILGRRIHPHMLRYSFASRLRSRGGDLQEVQQLMGHAEIGTTMRYSHITPTRKVRLEELLT